MSGGAWSKLGNVDVARPVVAEGEELAFLKDPLALLTPEERAELSDDLAELDRQRREVESESSTLRLA